MEIKVIKSGFAQTNTYLVISYNECLVIDPSEDISLINNYLNAKELKVKAILLTHGHFDHIGCAKELSLIENCPIYINKKDYELLLDPKKNGSFRYFRKPLTLNENIEFIEKEEIISIGLFKVNVFFTPGHTLGSVCYLIGDSLFSGDTLFKNGSGRTDLYGGDKKMIKDSLKFLFSLSNRIKVYPGHGEVTSIGEESKRV